MNSKHKVRARRIAAVIGASLLVSAPMNAATLMGDTVSVAYDFTVSGYAARDYVVSPAVELTCGYTQPGCVHNFSELDFGGNTISFKFYYPEHNTYFNYPFNGWLFTGLDFGRGIGGVTLTYNTGPNSWVGLSQSDVSFTATSISLNLAGASPRNNGWWTLTMHEVASTSAVPLPASLPLGAFAIASLAALKRRKRQ